MTAVERIRVLVPDLAIVGSQEALKERLSAVLASVVNDSEDPEKVLGAIPDFVRIVVAQNIFKVFENPNTVVDDFIGYLVNRISEPKTVGRCIIGTIGEDLWQAISMAINSKMPDPKYTLERDYLRLLIPIFENTFIEATAPPSRYRSEENRPRERYYKFFPQLDSEPLAELGKYIAKNYTTVDSLEADLAGVKDWFNAKLKPYPHAFRDWPQDKIETESY